MLLLGTALLALAALTGYTTIGARAASSPRSPTIILTPPPSPVRIPPPPLSLSGGGTFGCTVLAQGQQYCWGNNAQQQLGDNSNVSSTQPVAAPYDATLTQVSAGFDHACGIDTTGALYCWGDNHWGELGIGSACPQLCTLPFAVKVHSSQTFSAVSAGGEYTCAVTTGNVGYCWGRDDYGQLGIGYATSSPVTTPTQVAPSTTLGAVAFSSIATSHIDFSDDPDHTCGVSTAGAVFCWGDNSNGELGNGRFGGSVAAPAIIAGTATYTTVTAGALFSCGLTNVGAVECWGNNYWGQLGIGSYTSSAYPAVVSGGYVFASVSAGVEHVCGIAHTSIPFPRLIAYCWGDGTEGQLGTGVNSPSYTSNVPALVNNGQGFSEITTGDYFTCGGQLGAAVWCWGYNYDGELGDGSSGANANSAVPVQLTFPS